MPSSLNSVIRPTARSHKPFSLVFFAAPLLLVGCSFPSRIPIGGTPPPFTPPPPTVNPAVTAKHIYSVNTSVSVDVYTADLDGTVAPTRSYPGSAIAVTGDTRGNLYIGTFSATVAAVDVYASGATTASRSLTVKTAAMNVQQIHALAVDSAGNLYVALNPTTEVGGSDSILVYSPSAAGAATPIRTIDGALTMLGGGVTQMAFDAEDNLYVATGAGYKGSAVVEFAAGASGNIAPTIITSPDYAPTGVALDAAGQIYIVQGASPSPYNGTYLPAINVLPKGSVAGARPSRTIAGPNLGIEIYTDGIFVDSGGNIFIGTVLNGQTDFLVFSSTASGNVAPSSELIRTKGSTIDSQFFVM